MGHCWFMSKTKLSVYYNANNVKVLKNGSYYTAVRIVNTYFHNRYINCTCNSM